jgi:3-deoxy-D-arabino-heptulosonate 7-phosphate (DAHP) synthase class II
MVVLAGLVYGGYQGVRVARIAVAYAAEQTCSCLLVSDRTVDSCRGDLGGGMARLLSFEVTKTEVTATMLGIFSSRAAFEEGFGCHVAK